MASHFFSRVKYFRSVNISFLLPVSHEIVFHRALASGQLPLHSLKRQCEEQTTLCDRIIAILVCATNYYVKTQKLSREDYFITRISVVFFVFRLLNGVVITANDGM